ncbi:MAG: hypothetical protein HYU41_15765 [Candidatus Rokubacteria bacterium]|nr:hypothetical protein [Candidatus Rokubacteria bacterium]
MTIGFLLWRRGFFKVSGAVIEAALARGHRVVLLWDPEERKPGEMVLPVDLACWPQARWVAHRRGQPLAPLLMEHGVEALVAPSLYMILVGSGHVRELPALRAARVRLCSLDYAFDTALSAPAGYRVVDVTFYTSDDQRALHWRLMADGFAGMSDVDRWSRSAACGSTMTDQLAYVDRAAVRARYGVSDGKPAIVLMSLKMAVDPWRELVWGNIARGIGSLRHASGRRALKRGLGTWLREAPRGNVYRQLVDATRAFADRAGAALLIKTRAKNEDPPFLRAVADRMIEDETMCPYTSIELMAVADLCIHFQSAAVLEAALAGVPSLSVRIPQQHLLEFTNQTVLTEVYGAQPGTLLNWNGLVWSADFASAIAALATGSLADFRVDPEARRRYVEKFLGFDDTCASLRVVERIEALVAGV